jgi:hypothetical protein
VKLVHLVGFITKKVLLLTGPHDTSLYSVTARGTYTKSSAPFSFINFENPLYYFRHTVDLLHTRETIGAY